MKPAARSPTPAAFPTAEAAWFWTMQALERRQGGGRVAAAICAPETVVRCLDDIYRRRRIELLHVQVLRLYGRRGRPPRPGLPRERCDRILWQEAMTHLEDRLRARGVVAGLFGWLPPA